MRSTIIREAIVDIVSVVTDPLEVSVEMEEVVNVSATVESQIIESNVVVLDSITGEAIPVAVETEIETCS
jgi:hypothetical protein